MIVQELLDTYVGQSGKMIRPHLIKLFGELFELQDHDIKLLSRAAEMIHNASLIHDDVIDEAELRRGQKALNQIVSNSKAVLAGDFLLAQVITELVEARQYMILKTLAETLQNIVEGEFLQDDLKSREVITAADLTEVAMKKTGALLAWSCSATAILAGKSEDVIKKCETIGLKIGVAFQMIDDNLDFAPNTGKAYAKDLKEGLINYTALQLITLHPQLYYSIHQMRKTPFTMVPWTHEQISEAQAITQSHAERHLNEVREILQTIDPEGSSPIQFFLDFMKERNL